MPPKVSVRKTKPKTAVTEEIHEEPAIQATEPIQEEIQVKPKAKVKPNPKTQESVNTQTPNPVMKPSAAETVDIQAVAPEPKFIVDRDKQYKGIMAKDLLMLGIQLDADVYKMTDAEPILVLQNKNRFLTNTNFASATELNKYLTRNGKIPTWLELRQTKEKGLGVFAKENIVKGTYLGHYEGEYRPYNQLLQNRYCINTVSNAGQQLGYVDSENITFANWSRFINDGAKTNVEFCTYNCQVYLFATADITTGEELQVSYGETYWSKYGPKLD
jgi:hypothetical protein